LAIANRRAQSPFSEGQVVDVPGADLPLERLAWNMRTHPDARRTPPHGITLIQ
jgi:hypothetical protein